MSELRDFLRAEGYEVTPDGVVYSTQTRTGRHIGEIKSHHNKDGYLQVQVTSKYGRKSFKVHVLVAEFHLPKRPSPFHEVRHLDGSRDNNHVSNLAWGTKTENCADRTKHGRGRNGRTHCKNGHPFTDDNVYRNGNARVCKTCVRERKRRSNIAKKAIQAEGPAA